ncbi:hypothetical protein PFICI_00611 [Pestalotiopsis fici W106-1]|uniref:Uncharacterized protein n=1 Tax=Pestalotiopsis fici (strain W106-1 / CGMCC3.15140) TaxID=1229662 RepID=W3XL54_PESFW|nr:uncharacterized protein PFICI_00611 [Pestalotiopsis fici W106-1]ETS86783.1 hypothetical protein PFICI_00611 [Pestalotiopsis fici W106-1]
MPPNTSPSDFIYQRPLCSSSAAIEVSTSINEDEENGRAIHRAGYMSNSSTYGARVTTAQYHETLAYGDTPCPAPVFLHDVRQQRLENSHGFGASHTGGSPNFEPAAASVLPQFKQASYHHTLEDTAERSENRRISLATESTLGHRTFSIYSNASGNFEQFCDALNVVHDICLAATRAHLGSHHANRQARASYSGDAGHHRESDNPITVTDNEYKQPSVAEGLYHGPTTSSHAHPVPALNSEQATIPNVSSSLLKNISSICNMLWAGSQRDRLTVLNVERLAVDNMAKLLSWGETVALHDSDERALGNYETLHRALDAGKNLCAWLGAHESVLEMEELERAWVYASGLL